MKRYYFDIHDGVAFRRDAEGTQCETPEAARHEAICVLPEIANTKIPKAGDQQAFMVMVRDEQNTVVYTATLAFAGLWMGDTPIPEPEQSEE
ncbi:hypothetical protein FV232_22140 [Methylobacterium sp. WL30]|uniref:DUF6894 family protein n=1 Tax=unclassified Methylobacterium TaxID=2615210 RepID=UPI0011C9CF0D|nr:MULTISPECIES: hypothetical protein [unclassified Methylobacterium]TXN40688.1 hypothetical protein FV225_05430 [Methylobacterium sp. WL93]TXN50012.1 hypothetical protein FV227_14115 [Methylobacterium sp. WL119]TXN63899.1 hypothetical protein FV232_22140 [Methylobacterium sp. WL30]